MLFWRIQVKSEVSALELSNGNVCSHQIYHNIKDTDLFSKKLFI